MHTFPTFLNLTYSFYVKLFTSYSIYSSLLHCFNPSVSRAVTNICYNTLNIITNCTLFYLTRDTSTGWQNDSCHFAGHLPCGELMARKVIESDYPLVPDWCNTLSFRVPRYYKYNFIGSDDVVPRPAIWIL